MAGSRARLVRAFAAARQQQYGVAFEAVYQGGPIWHLSWTDGPGSATIRALAAAAELGGAQIGSYRRYSTVATALTAVRMAAGGRLDRTVGYGYRSGPRTAVESELADTDMPDRPDDEWHVALADRLIAVATATSTAAWNEYHAHRGPGLRAPDFPLDLEDTIATLLRDRGLSWLVEDAAAAGTPLHPLLVLSARYAPLAGAEQARAWRERAEPLPVAAAVAAAVADDQLSAPAARALLAVLPDLHAELARTEAAAIAAARRAGVTSAHSRLPGEGAEDATTGGGQ